MKYEILKRRHPQYNHDYIVRNEVLYFGGRRFKENLGLFLTPQDTYGQSQEYHDLRVKTSYDPVLANASDHFTSLLFSQALIVVESNDAKDPSTPGRALDKLEQNLNKLFQKNCNQRGLGQTLHDHAKEQFRVALRQGSAYAIVDLPEKKEYDSRYEQIKTNAQRPYISCVPNASVIDWELNEDGDFQWVRLEFDCPRRSTPFSPEKHYFEYWVMEMVQKEANSAKQVAQWTIFQSKDYEKNENPADSDDIPELKTAITSFTESNFVCLEVPDGLNFGDLIGPMCEELFLIDSLIYAAMNRAVVTVPWIGADDDIPGDDATKSLNSIALDTGRLKNPSSVQKKDGWMRLSRGDKMGILETKGDSIKILQEHREKIVSRIRSAVHQASQNIQVRNEKQAVSAASKQEDRKDEEVMLAELKLSVVKYIEKVYRLIFPEVPMSVKGLCTNVDEDPTLLLQQIAAFPDLPWTPEIFAVNFVHDKLESLLEGDLTEEDDEELRNQIKQLLKKTQGQVEEERQANLNNLTAQTDKKKGQIDPKSSTPSTPAPNTVPEVGETNNKALKPGSHTQTGMHINWQTVYDLLLKDYDAKDLDTWVPLVPWMGPVEVDINDIDFTGEEDWKANQPGPEGLDKVDEFSQILADKGFTTINPVILATEPHNDNKYTIIDGRHRVKAAQKVGLPVLAYIAQVGSMDQSTPHMQLHGRQKGSNNSS